MIVGSGSGGSTVAKTLAEGIPNVKILVIEKGNFLPDKLEEMSQVESEGMSTYYEKVRGGGGAKLRAKPVSVASCLI